jgi:hypothetical protein
MRHWAALGLFMAAVLGFAVLGVAITKGNAEGAVDTPTHGGTLKSVADFAAIGDTKLRSSALFLEAARVITDPRCMNCHPATRRPTQGETMHPHVPPIHAGEGGSGVAGLSCTACHQPSNTAVPGSRIGSVPGAKPWLLAPASMAWQGLSVRGICEQLKDRQRNGGRSLADIHKHLSTDHLVGWAWRPGDGRRPAAGTQEEFGALIEAWIATGAECPG